MLVVPDDSRLQKCTVGLPRDDISQKQFLQNCKDVMFTVHSLRETCLLYNDRSAVFPKRKLRFPSYQISE